MVAFLKNKSEKPLLFAKNMFFAALFTDICGQKAITIYSLSFFVDKYLCGMYNV